MGVAAEDAAASGQRLVARQMNAAMRAGDHLLGRLRRRRGAAAAPAGASRRAAARAGRRQRRGRAGTSWARPRAAGAGRPRARSASRHRRAAARRRPRRRRASPSTAPAEGAPTGEEAGEDEPAEDREHRLVIPAPVVAEPEAEDDRRREDDEAGARRSETSVARGAARERPARPDRTAAARVASAARRD